MDIRIEKTRQSIINAFIELRSHKAFRSWSQPAASAYTDKCH